jgi:uncharacterized membrane protein YvbJ
MKCPNCNFKNISDAKSCNACGTKFEISCRHCGKANPFDSKFCNQCGRNLSQAVTTQKETATVFPNDRLVGVIMVKANQNRLQICQQILRFILRSPPALCFG